MKRKEKQPERPRGAADDSVVLVPGPVDGEGVGVAVEEDARAEVA